MTDRFEILNTETVHVSRFEIIMDYLEAGGCRQEYSYINIQPGVCVIPLYHGKVMCIRQYRFPIRSWEYEFPGGFIDDDETPQEAAERELREETGLTVKKIVSLGYFYPSFGSTNEKIHLYAAECLNKGDTDREPAELISLMPFSIETFEGMVQDGTFCHGAGLAAWARGKKIIEEWCGAE